MTANPINVGRIKQSRELENPDAIPDRLIPRGSYSFHLDRGVDILSAVDSFLEFLADFEEGQFL